MGEMSTFKTHINRLATAAVSLYNEIWHCGRCGREFGDATACCAHEAQCGAMTHC
ncbi:MAG: hypothetical protein QOJ07_2866 [Thermoleophilaceae bacterium]|jgi:hypothetical protein|nr:hypothetical protein [Thermoleophilaceae bacterium]